jgi:microsomal dipeptidase-like Zn-dependent dipeptidase
MDFHLTHSFFHLAHINHIRNIAGIESLGLGGDFDGVTAYVLLYSFDRISISIIDYRKVLGMYRNIQN